MPKTTPYDFWILVGQALVDGRDKDTLSKLSRCNRALHILLSPYVYQYVGICELSPAKLVKEELTGFLPLESLTAPGNDLVKYVQNLEVLFFGPVSDKTVKKVEDAVLLALDNGQLVLLRKMVWCSGTRSSGIYGPTTPKVWSALSKLKTIRILEVEGNEALPINLFHVTPLLPFNRLSTLSLGWLTIPSSVTLCELINANRVTLVHLTLKDIALSSNTPLFLKDKPKSCDGLKSFSFSCKTGCMQVDLGGLENIIRNARLVSFDVEIAVTPFSSSSLFSILRKTSLSSLRTFNFALLEMSKENWDKLEDLVVDMQNLRSLGLHEESHRRQRLFPICNVMSMITRIGDKLGEKLETLGIAIWRLDARETKILTKPLTKLEEFFLEVDPSWISAPDFFGAIQMPNLASIRLELHLPTIFSSIGDTISSWSLAEARSRRTLIALKKRCPCLQVVTVRYIGMGATPVYIDFEDDKIEFSSSAGKMKFDGPSNAIMMTGRP